MVVSMHYTIHADHNPNPEDVKVLIAGLAAHAKQATHQDVTENFAFFIRDEAGKVVGGIKGITFYGSLYTDFLWVQKPLRKKGFGTELMKKAESLGRKRHCTFATVNTMSWEALAFYQRLNYEIEFVREGYKHGSKLYFLRKPLS